MASVIIIDDESFTEETPQSMDCSESPADNKLSALRTELLQEPNQNQAHFEETASGNSVEDESRAEAKKLEGNVYYKNEKYFDALKCYTEAIRMKPKCPVYYGNRSACYVMLGDYRAALDDARHAVELDAGFIKGYLRQIKCLIALGEWESAQKVIDKVKALDPENVDIKKDEEAVKSVMQYYQQAKDMIQRNAYDKAAALASLGLTISSQSTRLKLTLAEAKINMRKFLEGTKFTDEILRADPTNTDSIYVKGLALYYQGNLDYAITHFQRALKFEPDHAKAREVLRKAKKLKNSKEKANEAFAKNDLETAYKLYSEGIDADPLNTAVKSKLHFNRSLVHAKRKNFNEAIGECSEAIKLDDSYIKAYLKRAQLYTDQEMYQEAVQDYETVYDKHKSMEFEQLLNKAKAALARSKKRDFYKVLGIPKTATDDEIKKAYKKHAMLHHPDRHSNAPEDVKMEEEAKFKQVLEAYNTLSDQKKRCMYDLQQNTDTPVYGQRQYNPFNNDIFSFFTSAETGNYSYTYNR